MEIDFERGNVVLFGKTSKIETLIKKFTQLSGEQVYHFLVNRGIQIPRKMNCLALMSVLNKKIKFLNSNSLSKDYFQRLQYYNYFTEQQLFNLFIKIANDDESFYAYRYNLFQLMLYNYVTLDFNDGELTYVKNLKKAPTEKFEQYFNYISGACLEQEDTFDGVNIEMLKANMVNSASNQEVYDISGKYGIDIPQRLKKEEFLTFILDYMRENNTYNDEIAEELEGMTLTQLQTFANRVAIPMSPNMSKQESITYLFYFLGKCEIDKTSVKRIEVPPMYTPLEFTVDLDVITSFSNQAPKKIIHYDGEDDDKDRFETSLIAAIPVTITDEEPKEGISQEEIKPEENKIEEKKEEAPSLENMILRDDILNPNPNEEAPKVDEELSYDDTSVITDNQNDKLDEENKLLVDEILNPSDKENEEVNEEKPEEENNETNNLEENNETNNLEETNEEVKEDVILNDDILNPNQSEENPIDDINQENPVEELDENNNSEENEEVNEEKPESETENEVIDENQEETNEVVMLDEDLSDAPDLSDSEIKELIKEEKPEEVVEEKTVVFDVSNVKKNEQYGSEKLLKLKDNNTAKIVRIAIILTVIALIIAFLLYANFR